MTTTVSADSPPTIEARAAARPHIVFLLPRGEAVRNFIFTDTYKQLAAAARVTLLSVVTDEALYAQFDVDPESVVELKYYPEHRLLIRLRRFIQEAHFRWLKSAVALNHFEAEAFRAKRAGTQGKYRLRRWLETLAANRPILKRLTTLENWLTKRLAPTQFFHDLFAELKPDLLFNGSQFPVHESTINLPVNIAAEMGIPTAGFVFSWDNLTSRSRILEPYDYFVVWNNHMRQQLLDIYPTVAPNRVATTGTPQFDFHFDPAFEWSREQLCAHVGLDPARPFILYTTGIDRHFPDEHHHVQTVIDWLRDCDIRPKPQLVVRNYIKGVSPEMQALSQASIPDAFFPKMEWEQHWRTPSLADIGLYTNLVRHCAMGINAASTVSLELAFHDKPVMNIGFNPPGSELPQYLRWHRHIEFDHYARVVDIGGVTVAYTIDDMYTILLDSMTNPDRLKADRAHLINTFFDSKLDGSAGATIASHLLTLAEGAKVR